MTHRRDKSNEFTELRKQAEARLEREDINPPNMPPEESHKLVHELRTHQIELEMQNDELRKIQMDLMESRDRFSDLYDFAPIGYLTVSEKGLIEEANLTIAYMVGTERRMLLHVPMDRYIFEEDQDIYYLHRRKLLMTDKRLRWELRMQKEDGSTFWAAMDGNRVKEKNTAGASLRLVISDITDRKEIEARFMESLQEKEVLLREIHHRVKNNLAIISSLLDLQMGSSQQSPVINALQSSRMRIQSIARLYELLYRSSNFAKIDLKEYIEQLVSSIKSSSGTEDIVFRVDISKIVMDIDTAISCGLIVNELVTNSIKHAFPHFHAERAAGRGVASEGMPLKQSASLEHPEIEISMAKKDGMYTLQVRDNGIGISGDLDLDGMSTIGINIVDMLSIQLRGIIRSLHQPWHEI